MNITEAIKILKDHNEWRKGSDEKQMAEPKELSQAIDVIINYVEKDILVKTEFLKSISELTEGR